MLPQWDVPRSDESHMNTAMQVELEQEPIGIIISSGNRAEVPPRFTAFMWSPVPDEPEATAAGAGEHRAA